MTTTEGFLTDTDIDAVYDPPTDTASIDPPEVLEPADEPGADLVHLAPGVDLAPVMPTEEFFGLAAQARVLSGSALVPSALRGKPHDVFLVLLTGRDLGITATSALRSCYVVDGKVTIAPALKKSLIERQGLGAIRPHPDNDATQATAVVLGPDGDELGRVTVTMEQMAQVDGGKLVGKSNWRNYPQRMLWWRAVGYACDDYWPGVAYGLYSPDEIGGFIDDEGQPLDVGSVEVPDGFDRAKDRAKADPPIGDEAGGVLAQRALILPDGARKVFRGMLAGRELRAPLASVPVSKRGLVEAMLSGLGSRVRAGEWGEVPADDAEAVDAVLVCDYCAEAPCVCAPGEDQ